MERLKVFVKGWQRKSIMLLDLAGCPYWLIKWRCKPSKKDMEEYNRIYKFLKKEGF